MSSRIHYIFTSAKLVQCVQSVNILPRSLLYNKLVIGRFSFFPARCKPNRWRFNVAFLQNKGFINQLRPKLEEFIRINAGSVPNPMYTWVAVRAFLRNDSILFSSYCKRQREGDIKHLELECQLLENEPNLIYSEGKDLELKLIQSEFKDLLKHGVKYLMYITKHKYYSEGSKPSRRLAMAIKQKENNRNIPAIFGAHRKLLTHPQKSLIPSEPFFPQLYSSLSEEELEDFFDSIHLPFLSPEDIQTLDDPITMQELHDALKLTNKGHSLGIDHIPSELSLAFWELLGPKR